MNYISNSTAMCCCGFGDRDKIEVSETYVMIDCETMEDVKGFMFVPGHTYRCEKRWALMEAYTVLSTFVKKDEALAAYNKTVDGLRESNTVIDI